MADYIAVATIQQHQRPLWQIKLCRSTMRLLAVLNVLQRRQDGETILPREGTPEELLPVLEVLSPGEIEASVQAAVGLVCECHWQAGQEIMLLTSEEAEQVRVWRREKRLQPEPEEE